MLLFCLFVNSASFLVFRQFVVFKLLDIVRMLEIKFCFILKKFYTIDHIILQIKIFF